jgi:CBS domain-containing protein
MSAMTPPEVHTMTTWADLRVADVMTIDPITVRVEESIEHAERLLRLYHISGLPVVDDDDHVVGVISQTDLLWRGDLPLSGLLRRKVSSLKVGELMSAPALTVPMTTTLTEAARLMRDNRVHRLVAVSDDGAPIGVLSAIDYVTLFADIA